MIKYKKHPWVSAIWFRIIDKDHIRIFIDLSSEGKYAEMDYDDVDNEISLFKETLGEEYSICEEPLEIEFPEGKWDVEERMSGRYSIKLLFVRVEEEQENSDYWTHAEFK